MICQYYANTQATEQHVSYLPLRLTTLVLFFACWVWVWYWRLDIRVRDRFEVCFVLVA